ncbi:MAG: 16S rRNA (guanine(966)-N(2))-methyltransferase RsmD [Caldisericaceae bacterium]
MRIVSGAFKGIELISPPRHLTLRPTSDRVREAIFDVIRFEIVGKTFLDLFAGSGAVGIEAISEGSKFAYFVEKNHEAVNTIFKNIKKFGIEKQIKIFKEDVFKFLRNFNEDVFFDFVFLDPPYKTLLSSLTLEKLCFFKYLAEFAVVIVEHAIYEKLLDMYEGDFILRKFKEKTYGKIVISYYVKEIKQY